MMTGMARLTLEQRQRAGDAVADRRAELGLTQQELTQRAHVASDRVGEIERAGEWPQTRTRRALEEALGWKSGALLRIARGESQPADELVDAPKPPEAVLSTEAMRRILEMDLPPEVQQQLIARLPNRRRDVG
jgi:transcriptional regulator with XRE-family HTH domain